MGKFTGKILSMLLLVWFIKMKDKKFNDDSKRKDNEHFKHFLEDYLKIPKNLRESFLESIDPSIRPNKNYIQKQPIKPSRLVSRGEAGELKQELEYDARRYVGERLFAAYLLIREGFGDLALDVLGRLESQLDGLCDGNAELKEQTRKSIAYLK